MANPAKNVEEGAGQPGREMGDMDLSSPDWGSWWTGCPVSLINPMVPAHGHPPAHAGN